MTNFAIIINGMFSATDKIDYVNAICQPVQVKGESQRKANRGKMMETFREIFTKPKGEVGDT